MAFYLMKATTVFTFLKTKNQYPGIKTNLKLKQLYLLQLETTLRRKYEFINCKLGNSRG